MSNLAEFDQQLHGYRQGHQLLSTTIRLPKADQDLIDRLSDVAGPLSPSERFSPYLTLYPLPSEAYYVVARTWQDFDAPRAGCVRTRSVLVPMQDWMERQNVASIVILATEAGADAPAERRAPPNGDHLIPKIDPLQGVELIEAVFLEERVPVVVFESDMPEPLALRLTTALWPGFRRTFSLSTFARSPRTIGRRSFDLVFASKESRSRFADWKGRRIDGKKRGEARHPWSAPIIAQVLSAPLPSLKSLDVLGEMSSDGVGSESALRVSLLWDELRRKLPNSPTAVLGMLDIANTRKVRQLNVIRELEPALARAAAMAARTMQARDAWQYLGALVQKMEGLRPSLTIAKSIRTVAVDLSSRHPVETLEVLASLNVEPQRELMISAAGEGLSRTLNLEIANSLARLNATDLLALVLGSSSLAQGLLESFPRFSIPLASALRSVNDGVLAEARRRLLGLLVDDSHVEPARVFIDDLDSDDLIKETLYLHSVNGLKSTKIRDVLVERSKELGAVVLLREAVGALSAGTGRDIFIEATLDHTPDDMQWILRSHSLTDSRRVDLIRAQIEEASATEISAMLANQEALKMTVNLINGSNKREGKLLSRIAQHVKMPNRDYLDIVVSILPELQGANGIELIGKAIKIALPLESSEISADLVNRLLSSLGTDFDGDELMRAGLHGSVSGAAASRNLLAFMHAAAPTRRSLLNGIEQMANAMVDRQWVDVTTEASEAAASLLWESASVVPDKFVNASTILLPLALSDRGAAASPLISAAFPAVYRELAKDNAFDVLSMIFIFLDWDKCKSARRRLVDAFIHSDWRISDIAIAAARADDPVRILGRIRRERGGDEVLRSLRDGLSALPTKEQSSIRSALDELEIS